MTANPYHRLLGIPPEDQPPTHYRLLGIREFESDVEVIERAADQKMLYLRSQQLAKHGDECQRLLNEVAAAKSCLLNHDAKQAYDLQLKQTAEKPIPSVAASGEEMPLEGPVSATRESRTELNGTIFGSRRADWIVFGGLLAIVLAVIAVSAVCR